jgi:hypothetical protein
MPTGAGMLSHNYHTEYKLSLAGLQFFTTREHSRYESAQSKYLKHIIMRRFIEGKTLKSPA